MSAQLTAAAEAALAYVQTLHGEAATLHVRVHQAWKVARLDLADHATPLSKALAEAADHASRAEARLLEAIKLASCPMDSPACCMTLDCVAHPRQEG